MQAQRKEARVEKPQKAMKRLPGHHARLDGAVDGKKARHKRMIAAAGARQGPRWRQR